MHGDLKNCSTFFLLFFADIALMCFGLRWSEEWVRSPPFSQINNLHVEMQYENEKKTVFIETGMNIYSELKPYCHYLKHNNCIALLDAVADVLYNVAYCPTKANTTIEDFITTRYTLIDYLQQTYKYQYYLEIGCDGNITYDLAAKYFSYAICVDPVKGGTHRMTSDDFFKNNNETFDLIFIDGLHESHQVQKDIMHALRFLSPTGTIVLHDANPHFKKAQEEEPIDWNKQGVWNGDVWKAIVALRLQDGLEVVVGDFDYGVAVVQRRLNRHRLPMAVEDKLLGGNAIDILDYDIDFAGKSHELLRLMTIYELRQWLLEENNPHTLLAENNSLLHTFLVAPN